MNICVNGQQRQIAAGSKLSNLLEELQLCSERVVVEVNRQILTAPQHPQTTLNNGDNVEIVQFVGGG